MGAALERASAKHLRRWAREKIFEQEMTKRKRLVISVTGDVPSCYFMSAAGLRARGESFKLCTIGILQEHFGATSLTAIIEVLYSKRRVCMYGRDSVVEVLIRRTYYTAS